MNFDEIRYEAYKANMALKSNGLVIATFGNASAADHNRRVFAIKPSGVPYEELSPENMVIVDFDGKVIEGELRPSSDTLTHAVLYTEWEGIGGVVHTHSTYATAWAQSQKDVPILGTTHADHLVVDIPCAPVMSDEMIAGDYERMTGYQITQSLAERNLDPKDVEMILVSNHAPFTWGATVSKAVYNSIICEEISKMAFITRQINPDAQKLKEGLINKHYERKHGPNSYYGQD
ncbi:L-ribulose-5-phosphate 4-epimerase AraD [Membranihabitans maritimus]|uniref:L-ribulose-5-phosphate 4-epimerase AraD n=1 Tax=Membranihabitans maritimus TaxID=2904244 RepID=UPI001F39DB6D|nr:L-ribulose-5-phosphate 4-epimerase AraD [Membranihabitans maritimus]